jgi:hypothetical protein
MYLAFDISDDIRISSLPAVFIDGNYEMWHSSEFEIEQILQGASNDR